MVLRIDWNRWRGYLWKENNQWLLFDFRQKIIPFIYSYLFLANGPSPSKLWMVTWHVKHIYLQFKLLSLWSLQSVVWRAGLVSCDQRVDLLISVLDPRQLHCIRDLRMSQFQREPVNDCDDTLYLTFFSDLDRETGGTKLNISIKGINLARCFWFTPTISAQKTSQN